ncbi:MAG: hypothetical protein ABSF79_12470 [Smithellaceae bacterium]|jgi:hypothetical protein
MAKIIEVLVPTAETKVEKFLLNPRAHDLNGKVIGFLWDEKPNGDFLLKYLKEQISQRYKLVGTEWAQANGVHIAAEDAPEVQQISRVADMVIIAVGD